MRGLARGPPPAWLQEAGKYTPLRSLGRAFRRRRRRLPIAVAIALGDPETLEAAITHHVDELSTLCWTVELDASACRLFYPPKVAKTRRVFKAKAGPALERRDTDMVWTEAGTLKERPSAKGISICYGRARLQAPWQGGAVLYGASASARTNSNPGMTCGVFLLYWLRPGYPVSSGAVVHTPCVIHIGDLRAKASKQRSGGELWRTKAARFQPGLLCEPLMTPDELKASRERTIFMWFSAAAPLDIDPSTITSREPPAPDIACATFRDERMAFELVELCSPEVAKMVGDFNKRRGRACFTYATDPSRDALLKKLKKQYASNGNEVTRRP